MLAEIGGNAFGVGTDTSGKEEEGERHSRVVKPHYLTRPDSRPSVRSSETILATLNALMVECTESRAEADLPTDAVAVGSSDSNAQTE